jgi:hypothetical protein
MTNREMVGPATKITEAPKLAALLAISKPILPEEWFIKRTGSIASCGTCRNKYLSL